MKISVLLPRFSVSGVPLAQFRFAKAWARAGHDVDLIVGYVPPDATLPDADGVNLIRLDKPKVRQMLWPLVRYLRRVRPDVVFSAEDHLNTLALIAAALAHSPARVSGSSRVTPFDTYSNRPLTKRWFLKHIARLTAPRAAALTCVSQDMVEQYRQVFRNSPHVCVYNIVDDAGSRERLAEPLDDAWFVAKQRPVVVAAGSLQPWKGFADLIDAAALMKQRGRDVNVAILGSGPLRQELEQRIAAQQLQDRVRLIGHVDNPLRYFARADVFALTSRVEGMPNVLVEAMMAGCTPVSTDCPTGPRELLQGGRYGYLVAVGDPAAIATGIEQALDRPISPAVLDEAVRPFREEVVLARHLEVLGLRDVA